MEIYCIFMLFAVLLEVATENIPTKIFNYFESATVHSFRDQWTNYQKPMENAVSMALKETYGQKGTNVYVRKMRGPHKINRGYYHSDNQVQILLKNLEFDTLPRIWMPQITFQLPSHVLRIDASLSKMVVSCEYMVLRNMSSIIYDLKDQNYFKNSPFAFQQTDVVGSLGIIIEGCALSGFTVSMLNGPSVNLGHDNFNIYNCHYTLEIYNPGSKAPPVFAPYNFKGQGLNIDDLLMTSLREELMPKLQAAMYSYVNTTSLFGKDIPTIINRQKDIFRQTTTFMNDVARNMNKLAYERSITTVSMEDFTIAWDDVTPGKDVINAVKLHKIILTGLDTVYSSHTGGPISEPSISISEEIRFASLQIYGKADFYGDKKESYDFTVEIKDMSVSLLLELQNEEIKESRQKATTHKPMRRFDVTGWRSVEFSATGDTNISIEALVNGYLLKNLPGCILNHLGQVFDDAFEQTNAISHKIEIPSLNIPNVGENSGLVKILQTDDEFNKIENNDTNKTRELFKDSVYDDAGKEICKVDYSGSTSDADIQDNEEAVLGGIIDESADIQDRKEFETSDTKENVIIASEHVNSKMNPSSEIQSKSIMTSEEIKTHSGALENKI